MKSRKIWAAGLAMAAMAFGFSGCGKKPSAEEVLQKMQAAGDGVRAADADWNMDLEMSISMPEIGVVASTGAKAEGNTQYSAANKQTYTKATIDMHSGGQQESQTIEVYTEMPDAKKLDMYLLLEDQWLKNTTEVPAGAEEQDLSEYMDILQSLTLANEMVKRDDTACYQLEADIPVLEAIEKAQQLSEELEDSMDLADVDLSMFRNKAFHVTWYVREEDSLPQEIQLSLVDTAAKNAADSKETAAETATAADETEAVEESDEDIPLEVLFDTLDMSMTFDYPESLSVEIPAEVRENATDMEDLTGFGAVEEDLDDGSFTGGEGSAYEKLANPVLIREYAPEDAEALLADEKGVKVRISRVYTDGADNAFADFEIVNSSDQDVELYSNGSAWNHVMNDYGFVVTVKAGGSQIGCLSSPKLSDLQGDPALITLKLICSDAKSYDEIFNVGERDIKISEASAASTVREGGSVIYEDDMLQVTSYAPDTSQDYMISLPIAVYNKTDKGLSVSSMTVTIGGEEADAFVYCELFGDSIHYTSLDIFPAADGKLPEWKDVAFTLEAVDTATYETVLTTEEISVPNES